MRDGCTHLCAYGNADGLVDGVTNVLHGGRGNDFVNGLADVLTFLLRNGGADRILFNGVANLLGYILKSETTSVSNYTVFGRDFKYLLGHKPLCVRKRQIEIMGSLNFFWSGGSGPKKF